MRAPTKTKLLPIAAALLLVVAFPGFARSARNIYPQLVGVGRVALNVSPDNLPGLDVEALERDIRGALEIGGLRVQPTAPATLFVRVTYQHLAACPEFVVFRTYVALSEDTVVHRGTRSAIVKVDTWHESEEFVERASEAGKLAHQSALGLVHYFLDAAQYSATVIKRRAAQAQPK